MLTQLQTAIFILIFQFLDCGGFVGALLCDRKSCCLSCCLVGRE